MFSVLQASPPCHCPIIGWILTGISHVLSLVSQICFCYTYCVLGLPGPSGDKGPRNKPTNAATRMGLL